MGEWTQALGQWLLPVCFRNDTIFLFTDVLRSPFKSNNSIGRMRVEHIFREWPRWDTISIAASD
jgi:hypothetical protein